MQYNSSNIEKKYNCHICIIESSYENFSLKSVKKLLLQNKKIFNTFDTIIDDIKNQNFILSELINKLEKNEKCKGFIDKENLKNYSINKKNICKIPYVQTFIPNTILSLRLLNNGCYWRKCVFCVQNNKYNQKVEESKSDISNIVDKLNIYVESGYSIFNFIDEALEPNFIYKICNEIINRNIKIRWVCRCRIDTRITKEILKIMKRAGCKEILYGLESASDRILKLMNKHNYNMTIEKVEEILKNTYEIGIRIHITTIIGFPGETIEEAMQTLNFLKKNSKNRSNVVCVINKFTLFKNTVIYNNPKMYNIQLVDSKCRLDSICEFNYLKGDYKEKKVVDKTVYKIVKAIYEELGWKNFDKDPIVLQLMKIYFSTAHAFLLKENNSFLPENIEQNLKKISLKYK